MNILKTASKNEHYRQIASLGLFYMQKPKNASTAGTGSHSLRSCSAHFSRICEILTFTPV